MQQVRVGNEILQFPDTMSDNEIKNAIQKYLGQEQKGFFQKTRSYRIFIF